MTLVAKDYAEKVRGSTWERELIRALRKETEADRLRFIEEFSFYNVPVAMVAARQALAENASYFHLLKIALEQANASSIRYWLDCIVPRLGVRKVLSYLASQVEFKPEEVTKARYWMPNFAKLPGFRQSDLDAIDDRLASFGRKQKLTSWRGY